MQKGALKGTTLDFEGSTLDPMGEEDLSSDNEMRALRAELAAEGANEGSSHGWLDDLDHFTVNISRVKFQDETASAARGKILAAS